MKQQFWSGLVTALFVGTVGVASSKASQDQIVEPAPTKKNLDADITTSQTSNVIKMGERQSQEVDPLDEGVANISLHTLDGRKAVTLYVRNTPVLTFLGARQSTTAQVKVATVTNSDLMLTGKTTKSIVVDNPQDPVWRATTVAAKLNQFNRKHLDAKSIKVFWNTRQKQYVVRSGSEQLVELNAQTILPRGARNPAADALQFTNQLRRRLGDAPPLRVILGQPVQNALRLKQIALRPLRFLAKGWASWYGPGFQGNSTASGERFNQYALTAAHRTLPFGTQVRVTNLHNGRTVVVRINDRGPYSYGRVIDLSRKAAQLLGVISSGVAPVRVDVLK